MKKYHALALDDDPKFNKLLEKKLGDKGIVIKSSTSVAEFFKFYKERSWDFCLIDLNLSEGPEAGFHVIKALSGETKSASPMLVLSRANDQEKVAHAIECGAEDYLTKPLDVDMLLSKIRYLIGKENEWESQSTLGMAMVPAPARRAQLTFDLLPMKISEEGVLLKSKCFVAKGSTVALGGEFAKEIFSQDSVRLMVAKNARPSEHYYTIFLEFGVEQTDLVQAAKDWIHKRKDKSESSIS